MSHLHHNRWCRPALLFVVVWVVPLFSAMAENVRFGEVELQVLERLEHDVSIFDQEIHFDDDGLIVHRKGNSLDGGDTCQREGWYWFGIWLRQKLGIDPWPHERALSFDRVVELMEPERDGIFYRHPKLRPWNDPSDKNHGTSRDQLEPMIAALGVWGKDAELRRLWNALPETFIGKHAFNGKYKSIIGQIGEDIDEICDDEHADDNLGPDCDAIQGRSCDEAPCVLKVDDRPCDLQKDDRPCDLKRDDRSCGRTIDVPGTCHRDGPFGTKIPYPCKKKHRINDPHCEAAKAAANALHKAEKDRCEAEKAKANVDHKLVKDACEAAKVGQNLIYKSEYDHCQVEKAAKRLKCEVDKGIEAALCRMGSIHCGDPILPMTVNLFRRALNENPMNPASTVRLPPVNVGGGQVGENDLSGSVLSRVHCAKRSAVSVGDDLNLIVRLFMAQQRFPTPISEASLRFYSLHRAHSYGSFFVSYIATYGDDFQDLRKRMRNGVEGGWEPDVIPAVGATRWYHRPSEGANPRLADLYQPILELLLPESRDQTNVGGTDYDNKNCDN